MEREQVIIRALREAVKQRKANVEKDLKVITVKPEWILYFAIKDKNTPAEIIDELIEESFGQNVIKDTIMIAIKEQNLQVLKTIFGKDGIQDELEILGVENTFHEFIGQSSCYRSTEIQNYLVDQLRVVGYNLFEKRDSNIRLREENRRELEDYIRTYDQFLLS